MAIRQIAKEEFDTFPVQRVPLTGTTWNEEEFHRDEAGNVLGVVIHVVEDNDWAWAALGRDADGDFRAFANDVCLPTRDAARAALIQRMEAGEGTRAVIVPHGNKTSSLEGIMTRTRRRTSVRMMALLTLAIFLFFLFLRRGRLW